MEEAAFQNGAIGGRPPGRFRRSRCGALSPSPPGALPSRPGEIVASPMSRRRTDAETGPAGYPSGSNSKDAELMQYLSPVGWGPSGKM